MPPLVRGPVAVAAAREVALSPRSAAAAVPLPKEPRQVGDKLILRMGLADRIATAAAAAAALMEGEEEPQVWTRGRITVEGIMHKLKQVHLAESAADGDPSKRRRVAGCSQHLLERRSPIPLTELPGTKAAPERPRPARVSEPNKRLYPGTRLRPRSARKPEATSPAVSKEKVEQIVGRLYDSRAVRLARQQAAKDQRQWQIAHSGRPKCNVRTQDEWRQTADRLCTECQKERVKKSAELHRKLLSECSAGRKLTATEMRESSGRLHDDAMDQQRRTLTKLRQRYLH
eukprot:TRINITY_DN1901_c0_g1_i2.p1 TRINITY_DN1901_c0_g1~~TRINITY_DN1901_c0_g1_i2.p1  ORF type:complete len:287 (+),score=73.12 TRINITY_DN1901_c0_g1_i2:48-908(+)